MSPISRRDFLKAAGVGLGAALAGSATAEAAAPNTDPNTHFGMLYDATICTGCNACTTACRKWNHTTPELDSRGLYDAPQELTAKTWTLIQLYQGQSESSFVKRQCMHCIDPACVSGCPVHALQKTDTGPVTYDSERCIGCRYCMYTCPFHVPRFQWDAVIPVIAKCTLCKDRLANGQPTACAEVCPTGALSFGRRGDLLAAAEKRLADSPDRYYPHIYGKDDAGGTSVMYLSAVPFTRLGLPDLGTSPVPRISERTGNLFIPTILIGGPLVLASIRQIAKAEGWG